MSDEIGDWSDNGEAVEVHEVTTRVLPRFFLGQSFWNEETEDWDNKKRVHGDIHFNPAMFGTFNDESGTMDAKKRADWMRRYTVEEPAEDEESDMQGWTYVADYSVHAATPDHTAPYRYYLHARIRKDNLVEFGAFDTIHKGKDAKVYPLAHMGLNNETPFIRQRLHGDLQPALRIAGKEESEKVLLKNGKLIFAAAPKLIGAFMNVGNALVTLTYGKTTSYFLKTYYGHIWVYWGAILDNVFYMVGIPVFNTDEPGTLVYSPDGENAKRVYVSLPPTEDDLRSSFSGVLAPGGGNVAPFKGGFYNAVEMLWGVDPMGGMADSMIHVDRFLDKYGDRVSPIQVAERALCKVQISNDGSPGIIPLYHGDIYGDLSLLGYEGGVFQNEDGALIPKNADEVVYNFEYEKTASGGWATQSGASGFICSRTKYSKLCDVVYCAQAFYSGNFGKHYFIRTVGCLRPYMAYNDGVRIGGVDVALTRKKREEEEDEEPDPPIWYVPPGGGDDDDTEEEDSPPGSEDVGDCGVWFTGGTGVSVKAYQDTQALKVRYEFKVEITDSFSETVQLHYDVNARFSVADGGSYSVPPEGTTLTMWYYLSGSIANISVHNLTSSSASGGGWTPNSHPTSVTEFSQTGFRQGRARAEFGTMYVTNYADPSTCNQSNIVQVTSTGGTKKVTCSIRYKDSRGMIRRKTVTGTMRIYSISLRRANIKNILKNHLKINAPSESCTASPGSITGSTGGSAGPPTVTYGGATIKPIALPTNGETSVTGSFKMRVRGSYGEMSVSYNVTNACSGWYEETPSNRFSVSISGTFKLTVASRTF